MFIITLLLYRLLKLAACSDHFIRILPHQAGAKNTDVILIQTIFTPWIMRPPMQCVDIINRPTVFLICLVWISYLMLYQQGEWSDLTAADGWAHMGGNVILCFRRLISAARSCFNSYYEPSLLNTDRKFIQSNRSGTFNLKHKQFYFPFIIDYNNV